MKTDTETTSTPDSLELAKDAINYTLQRIQRDENIRYHMGAFTEAFEKLKAAHSALTGISPEAIEAETFDYPLKYTAKAELLQEVCDLLNQRESSELSEKVMAIIRK